MENFPATQENNVQVSVDTDIETFTSLVEASATMTKMEPVISLTAEYISLEKPGESFRGIFIGYQKISKLNQSTGEMQEMEAAKFVQKNKPKNNGTENRAKAARTKKNGGKVRPDILLRGRKADTGGPGR
jgi:hypothetical protein